MLTRPFGSVRPTLDSCVPAILDYFSKAENIAKVFRQYELDLLIAVRIIGRVAGASGPGNFWLL